MATTGKFESTSRQQRGEEIQEGKEAMENRWNKGSDDKERGWERSQKTASGEQGHISGGPLKSSMGEMAREAGEELKERAEGTLSGLSERAQGFAQDVAHKAEDVAEKAKEWATDATENVSTYIRSYSVRSLAVGLGIGFLAGYLISSRRD